MIRLPTTSIVLGASDIADFEARRRQPRQENVQTKSFSITGARRLPLAQKHIIPGYSLVARPVENVVQEQGSIDGGTSDPFLAYRQSTEEPLSPTSTSAESADELSVSTPVIAYPDTENHAESAYRNESTQNANSPAKDDFYYGGFVESPVEQLGEQVPGLNDIQSRI